MRNWTTSGGYRIIQVLSGRSNAFLLTNGVKNVLTDTGPAFMWPILQNRLDRAGIKKIDLLILTHSHFDHAANAAKIKEKYKAPVLIHSSEACYLRCGDNILPSGTNGFARLVVRLLAKKIRTFAFYEPCNPDYTIDQTFDLSGMGFNAFVLHTPGHTKGSVSLIIGNEIALTGDTMFGVFPGSIFPPFAYDVNAMINSWQKLLSTECSLFIPSHGTPNKRSLVELEYLRHTAV